MYIHNIYIYIYIYVYIYILLYIYNIYIQKLKSQKLDVLE